MRKLLSAYKLIFLLLLVLVLMSSCLLPGALDVLSDSDPDTVTVKFNTNGGTKISSQTISTGSKVSKPQDPIKDGYVFLGWKTSLSVDDYFDFSVNIQHSMTLYAHYLSVTELLDISSDGTVVPQKALNSKSIKSLSIPGKVKGITVQRIGYKAFSDFKYLESVKLPSTVITIENYAFNGCSALQTISFPASLETIGAYAFYECTSLKSVELSDSVSTINEASFYGCTSLEKLVIGKKCTYIGNKAFAGCKNLYSAVVYGDYIGDHAFSGCYNLVYLSLPEEASYLGEYAFNNCSKLSSINIPKIKVIKSHTFYGCSNLMSVVVPDSVTSIGEEAFGYCSKLQKVYIGPNIKKIYVYHSWGTDGAFNGCSNLKEIRIKRIADSIPRAPWGVNDAVVIWEGTN